MFKLKCTPLLSIVAVVVVSGCLTSCTSPDDASSQISNEWPVDLVPPIEGATFSLRLEHMPHSRYTKSPHWQSGYVFTHGYSGRPLTQNEPVVAIASGTITRIDHAYQPNEPTELQAYLDFESDSGHVGRFARDQLSGRQVWIRHDKGHVSKYGHLSSVNPEIALGDSVDQGQVIGLTGSTGIIDVISSESKAHRLLWQLWMPDGETYLGQDEPILDLHRKLAQIFSKHSLPRFTQQVLADVSAGREPSEPYPPRVLPESNLTADIPDHIYKGRPFVISVIWAGREFEESSLFGLLENRQLGVLAVDEGALLFGAAEFESDVDEMNLVLGGVDSYGQTMAGSQPVKVRQLNSKILPLEVDYSILARYTETNLKREDEFLKRAASASLEFRHPFWNEAFSAPIDGTLVGRFGQMLYHSVLVPQHSVPGLLIYPTDGPQVHAANDGVVVGIEELPIRGKTIAIAHGGGIVSLYSLLDTIEVKLGDDIQRQDVIGRLSQSGDVIDRVLLWEMHVTGIPTDPLSWLDRVLPEDQPNMHAEP